MNDVIAPKYQLVLLRLADIFITFLLYYSTLYFEGWLGVLSRLFFLISCIYCGYYLLYFFLTIVTGTSFKELIDIDKEEAQEIIKIKVFSYLFVSIFLLASWSNYHKNQFIEATQNLTTQKKNYESALEKQKDKIDALKLEINEIKNSLNDEFLLSQKYNDLQLEKLYNRGFTGNFVLRDIHGNKTLSGTLQNGKERGIWTYYDSGEEISKFEYVRVRSGATCRDGSTSYATGRGACSWHGGVAFWNYSYERRRIK
jgi:cell division protein FtsB